MRKRSTLIRSLRFVAGCSLVGTVTAGVLFGWLPALGFVTIHELGAAIGALAGGVVAARHAA